MPTSRPRYLLTESDDLRTALETAGRRWPQDRERPTALLLHLIDEGRARVDEADVAERTRRLAVIAQLGSGLEDVYPTGYLADLRADWPE